MSNNYKHPCAGCGYIPLFSNFYNDLLEVGKKETISNCTFLYMINRIVSLFKLNCILTLM